MIQVDKITTLKELKASGYRSRTIKDELRENLLQKLQNGEEIFPELWGYENSVIPELQRAILSKHNINLLGLRGQAKTRLARALVTLLDEQIPVIEGSEINDDPFVPISSYAQQKIKELGENTPISWLAREKRFYEKLATPDVTVADLIGDLDPIKAASLKLSYSDERVIHYGMIPRANRCIFVINELPDLQPRIQVALFNILQEGDIQIRGFQLRMDLDLQFVFTANPEDYTNRGSIVTPLKDRIGSQILTHYPESIEIAKRITAQEASIEENQQNKVFVPEIAKDLLEQISFEARKSPLIDAKSGVSARMSISAYQNLISSAELRALQTKQSHTTVRLSDFMGIIPAITGKIELVYEGEQEGAAGVAEHLIGEAVKSLFNSSFEEIKKLENPNSRGTYQDLLDWFAEQTQLEFLDDTNDQSFHENLNNIQPLVDLINKFQSDIEPSDRYFFMELIIWGLAENQKLNRYKVDEGYQFHDTILNKSSFL